MRECVNKNNKLQIDALSSCVSDIHRKPSLGTLITKGCPLLSVTFTVTTLSFFVCTIFVFILYIYRSDKAKYLCIFTSYYVLF